MNEIISKIQLINNDVGMKIMKKMFNVIFTVLLCLDLFILAMDMISNNSLNSLNFVLITVIPIVVECQFIFCIAVVSYILRRVNNDISAHERNLSEIEYYSYELFSLSEQINKNFNHIILKILSAFVNSVVCAVWDSIDIRNNTYRLVDVIETCVWILSNQLGIFVILYFCCFLANEVSLTYLNRPSYFVSRL